MSRTAGPWRLSTCEPSCSGSPLAGARCGTRERTSAIAKPPGTSALTRRLIVVGTRSRGFAGGGRTLPMRGTAQLAPTTIERTPGNWLIQQSCASTRQSAANSQPSHAPSSPLGTWATMLRKKVHLLPLPDGASSTKAITVFRRSLHRLKGGLSGFHRGGSWVGDTGSPVILSRWSECRLDDAGKRSRLESFV